ncbi:hypothetical protein DMUE_5222 [Dictyocoela muelleri]|nr:hypothetical protein DMUE_5222 [Dictyocoela muelleri]
MYNNTIHLATKANPFILFKNFDYCSFSNYDPQNNIDANIIRQRLMEYVSSYRREFEIRSRETININSRVLLVRPYNGLTSRRQYLWESLYYPEVYIVNYIDGEYCIMINSETGAISKAHLQCLKLIFS